MTSNPGYQPPETKGKRIRPMLACGRPGRCDDNPMSPPGWAADSTRWTLTDHPFDLSHYELIV